ncbi:hypothetical protein ABZX30_07120 [Streptomyces sp. NPDC004542]|uniref:hypothetical protein n=1 Tax=Streptomyces sp. NPDC004542 TaxID=3154281 RepID=UPI0033ACD41A
MRQPHTAVNRFALGIVGLALLLAGGWLAATGTVVARPLPSWWPAPAAGHRLLPAPDRPARLRGEGWWTPSVTAAAIALTVLLACWSVARLRSGRSRPLPLAAPGGSVRGRALAQALTLRAEAVPGVARGRARVVPRSRRRLEVRLRVWLSPDTSPDEVLPALCAVTAEAGTSAAPYTAYTRLRLSAASHRRPHVR